MFIHTVLFEIRPKEVSKYRKDSRMWAHFAKKRSKGFIAYFTVQRVGYRDQYASVYTWKRKSSHDAFMERYHDWLVSKSKAKVRVLGYYNLRAIDKVK